MALTLDDQIDNLVASKSLLKTTKSLVAQCNGIPGKDRLSVSEKLNEIEEFIDLYIGALEDLQDFRSY